MNKINYPTQNPWQELEKENPQGFILVERDPHFDDTQAVIKKEEPEKKTPWWKLNMIRGLV